MMYPYITLADETEITHSHLLDVDGVEAVEIHFEKPIENGFASARCQIPTYQWLFNDGFQQEELSAFLKLVQNNAHLFYRFAKQGGICCA